MGMCLVLWVLHCLHGLANSSYACYNEFCSTVLWTVDDLWNWLIMCRRKCTQSNWCEGVVQVCQAFKRPSLGMEWLHKRLFTQQANSGKCPAADWCQHSANTSGFRVCWLAGRVSSAFCPCLHKVGQAKKGDPITIGKHRCLQGSLNWRVGTFAILTWDQRVKEHRPAGTAVTHSFIACTMAAGTLTS